MSRRERLEQLGNQPKKFTNVYVKNFGEDMTEADFRELVDSFGKVLSLKVVTSDQGRSKGFGFVSFETPEEAQQVSRRLMFNILSAILLGFRHGLCTAQIGQLWQRFLLSASVDHVEESSFFIYTECKYGGPLGRRPGRVMKVRLVRPRCFVLTMLPLKSLASWTG